MSTAIGAGWRNIKIFLVPSAGRKSWWPCFLRVPAEGNHCGRKIWTSDNTMPIDGLSLEALPPGIRFGLTLSWGMRFLAESLIALLTAPEKTTIRLEMFDCCLEQWRKVRWGVPAKCKLIVWLRREVFARGIFSWP